MSSNLNLLSLQSKMKCDPKGYESELRLIYRQFKSSIDLFEEQVRLKFTSFDGIRRDSSVAKNLSATAMFLAHVTKFYPKHLSQFPKQLADFLNSSSKSLPRYLRCDTTKALILLTNQKMVDFEENLSLFMELQTLDDRPLRELTSTYVINSIQRMNQRHKNQAKNRALQKILFRMLEQEDEAKANRSFVTLCELHRRKVWFDEKTSNALCSACFHPSPRIMKSAISFLLDYEKNHDGEEDSDDENEDAVDRRTLHAVLSKELIYKAHYKGTSASKKKKKAKLQRVMRSMKKQQRVTSDRRNSSYSPLNHLRDAQGFAEKLFSQLRACNERFEVRMMMVKVIARTIGLHQLILLNFYPYLQKYVQPHQRDITNLLAAAVEACHEMVPLDAVEPLFKQIVTQFIHNRSKTEFVALGLNVVTELCRTMPSLMTEDLLQDLVLYKKSWEKVVSTAALSLRNLFREICPSLLAKKDRGRLTGHKERSKALADVDEEDGDRDEEQENEERETKFDEKALSNEIVEAGSVDSRTNSRDSKLKKRKYSDLDHQHVAADSSLRAGTIVEKTSKEPSDGILSDEDFQRIKELKAKKDARIALTLHGLLKKDDAKPAGREDRGKYQARAAVKQKKI